MLKAIRATVIGIGHFTLRLPGCEIKKQFDLVPVRRRAVLLQSPQMRLIHRQQQIEMLKVMRIDLARPQRAQINIALARMLLRAPIRRFADVIIIGTRRINFDLSLQPALRTIWRNKPSAVGLRQILPVQTIKTE